ncbi:hypothetical protein Tco_1187493 [Tanacetum coccineum]
MGRRWSGGAVVERGEVVLVVCGVVGVVREGGCGVELAAMAAMAWMMMIKMCDEDDGRYGVACPTAAAASRNLAGAAPKI